MMSKIDESALDRHYVEQQRVLNAICAEHENQTDLAIVETWQKIFNKTPGHDKFERSCLMLLMCTQLKEEGSLGKPFTDMRNCTLELTQVLNEYDKQHKTIDEPNKGSGKPAAFKVVDVLLAPPRQRTQAVTEAETMAEDECLPTYDSHTNCCKLHYNGQRPILGETELRMRAPDNHTIRLCSGAVENAVDKSSLNSEHLADRWNYSFLELDSKTSDTLNTSALFEVNNVEEKDLHNHEQGQLELKEKKSVLSLYSTVSCDDCCRKHNCPCMDDMAFAEAIDCSNSGADEHDSGRSLTPIYEEYVATVNCCYCTCDEQCEACYLRQENAELERQVSELRKELETKTEQQQHVKQCLECMELTSAGKRLKHLHYQIMNSARIGIRRIRDWRFKPEEQINILVTTFGKLTDDEKFKSQLHALDRRLERVLLGSFELKADRRDDIIELNFMEMLKQKFYKRRERDIKRLKMLFAAEQQHAHLVQMMNIIILKKLFLQICMGKVENTSAVLSRWDHEYDKLAKQL